MKEVNFVKKIEEVLKKCGCLQECNIYTDGKVKKYGSTEIDWEATNKLEEETGNDLELVYIDPKVTIEEVDSDPIGEGNIQLTYDGGYLHSIMNCEFGTLTYWKVIKMLDKACEKYGYSYEHYTSWATVFYKN